MNTIIILANQGKTYSDYAAGLCANTKHGEHGDWYLPSKEELNLLYIQKNSVGGFSSSTAYRSSTEYWNTLARSQYFSDGNQTNSLKNIPLRVCCIRAF